MDFCGEFHKIGRFLFEEHLQSMLTFIKSQYLNKDYL